MASLATSTLVYSTPVRIKTSSKPGSSSRNCKKTVPFPVTRADSSSLLLDAAKYTVDKHIQSGMVVGLGSGQASGMAIQYLGRLLRAGALKDVVGVPMSVTSASEAAKAGIPLDGYQDSSQIDFAFDDADIIEEETLVAIIGRQKSQADESIIQEKSILSAAKKLVFMITGNKYLGSLEGSIPVLVQALNWMETAEEIEDLFLGDAEVWRRSSIGQADPMGGDFPLITRDGHNVLDVIFTSPIQSLAEVAESLDKVDGVVDHGVISKLPCTVVIAAESGGLNIVDR
ncbi:hypothetical protein OIU78_025415 [Salix suchowensis]|nr:ribose-5-phosphate isomerase [Salix suchowensis]KAJ6293432.1 hypothetical protein OIU78_025415 [Salix suchowensis]